MKLKLRIFLGGCNGSYIFVGVCGGFGGLNFVFWTGFFGNFGEFLEFVGEIWGFCCVEREKCVFFCMGMRIFWEFLVCRVIARLAKASRGNPKFPLPCGGG